MAVVAAGQPAPIIANMKPEAQKYIKLLKFDPNHPASKPALEIYAYATVRASSYPNLLTEDFTTISVGAFLVTYDYNMQGTVDRLPVSPGRCARTSRSCRPRAIRSGARSASTLPELSNGWTYYPPTTREIRNCLPEKTDQSAGEETREDLHRGGADPRSLQLSFSRSAKRKRAGAWPAPRISGSPEMLNRWRFSRD